MDPSLRGIRYFESSAPKSENDYERIFYVGNDAPVEYGGKFVGRSPVAVNAPEGALPLAANG